MKHGITIAGFILLGILFYIAWTDLNSKLVAIEADTESYLFNTVSDESPPIEIPPNDNEPDPAPVGIDTTPLLQRLDAIEAIQADTRETLERIELRLRQLETASIVPGGKIVNREIIYFDFDDVTLRADETTKIDRLLETIEEQAFVSLIGHTDTSGDNRYNHWLSLSRAASVKRYIDSRLQADNARDKLFISISGTGEESVVNPTGDDIRDDNNRIVEILVFE